ncbi:MAG: glycosyltransferase [Luteitalea sp.]|nr:glycosyltransferase [Luteitalea sp.]
MLPSLDVVVVNWNGGRLLHDCIESVGAIHDHRFELRRVVVVDNGSSDGSMDGLEWLDSRVEVIRSRRNLGFAAACNRGAIGSTADYLLFLNPDTRVTADALARPVEYLASPSGRDVGIVGPRLVDDEGATSRSCARFPTPAMFVSVVLGLNRLFPRRWPSHVMSEWDHRDTRQVEHVCGAFYAVRRLLFQALDGFDERFFLYLEDLDFSRRAALRGSRTMFLADAVVYHKGGGASQAVKALRLGYALHSRILYGYKHFPRRSATALAVGTLCVEPLIRLAHALGHLDGREITDVVLGYVRLWRRVLGDLWRHRGIQRWTQIRTDTEGHG